MKLKNLMGMALFGALAFAPAAASAQGFKPIEPLYVAPKILYSHQGLNSFANRGVFSGPNYYYGAGTYKGQDVSKSTFGGGLAIGYDFSTTGQSPVRLEAEYLWHGQAKMNPGTGEQLTANNGAIMASQDINSVKNDIHTLFANVYWDFHNDSAFTPYIGVGAGAAYVNTRMSLGTYAAFSGPKYWNGGVLVTDQYVGDRSISDEQNCWNFAWNASAGFSYQITDATAVDLSYRYSDFGEAKFGTKGHSYALEVAVDENDSTKGNTLTSGKTFNKGTMDLTSHEVILGLRFSAF